MSKKPKGQNRVRKTGPPPLAEDPESQARAAQFARNFSKALSRRGMGLSELADKTGINLDLLSRWKNQGRVRVNETHLHKVAQVLEFEPETIWDDDIVLTESRKPSPYGVVSLEDAQYPAFDRWRREVRQKLDTLLNLPEAQWIARAVDLAYMEAKQKYDI